MMMIVRLYPKGDKEKLWQCVLPVLQNSKSEHFRPLYISQWEPVEFTTVMIDVANTDGLFQFFTKDLAQCDMIDRSRTMTLMRPIFYPVPKDRPKELHRFRIALQVETPHLEAIYNKMTDIDYCKEKCYPTYQAFSFGEDDILLSILAENEECINNLIQERILLMEGVLNAEYIRITKSFRIIPKEEWNAYRKKLYRVKHEEELNEMDEEFDWSLESMAGMTGGFIDEL